MTTLARGRKNTPPSKSKPKKPSGRFNSSPYAGYESWLQFKRAYAHYLDEHAGTSDHGPYAPWDDGGQQGLHALQREAYPFTSIRNLTSVITAQPVSKPDPNLSTAPTHLYALEIEDLDDFTTEDILHAWEARAQSCGSQEAAAEMFALYQVLIGEDDLYAGATAYLYHPQVLSIFTPAAETEAAVQEVLVNLDGAGIPDQAIDPLPEAAEAEPLSLADICNLSTDQLKSAWTNRPDSFASLEAAAETLSILRSLKAAEPTKPSYRQMMEHALILELEDSLPYEGRASAAAPSPTVELAILTVDRRTTRTQVSVTRPGQSSFRSDMLNRFGGECCISGCRVETLLEAAHIIPYRGDQSDDVTNGLLLRVDLHRLFDAHLVTINPNTFTVEVANSVEDTGYQAYHGQRLFVFSPKPRILFLENHYRAFKARHGG